VDRKIAIPVNEYLRTTDNNWWSTIVGWVSPKKDAKPEYVLAPIVSVRVAFFSCVLASFLHYSN